MPQPRPGDFVIPTRTGRHRALFAVLGAVLLLCCAALGVLAVLLAAISPAITVLVGVIAVAGAVLTVMLVRREFRLASRGWVAFASPEGLTAPLNDGWVVISWPVVREIRSTHAVNRGDISVLLDREAVRRGEGVRSDQDQRSLRNLARWGLSVNTRTSAISHQQAITGLRQAASTGDGWPPR